MKKEEKLLHAIAGLDERLIEEAMAVRVRKNHAILRWAAVAACICLVLTVTVGAIATGNVIVDVGEGFRTFFAPENYPASVFSQEALDAVRDTEGIKHTHYPMSSLAEAEEFIGMKHLDNDILDQAVPKEVDSSAKDIGQFSAAHSVRLDSSDGEILGAQLGSYYTVEQAAVSVQYVITTDKLDHDGGFSVVEDSTDTQTHYVTPSGMECVVYSITGHQDWSIPECMAFASKGDILVIITVTHHDLNVAETMIRGILDAYG